MLLVHTVARKHNTRILTVLRLQIPMEDHGFPRITYWLDVADETHDITASRRRIFTVVAAVQGTDNLAEDAPDKLLLAHLVLVLQVANDSSQVAVSAVLHVEVKVLGCLDMVAFEIGDNVWVSEFLQDGKLSLQLFALLLGHFEVADLFAAQNLFGGQQTPTINMSR